ncbi:hypothetical protein I3J27_21410 [Bradyrhizobium xenonodulans]|uniref:Uncharacterized protein n=1 Tax=Bradyrhizobium xenonodulans TaxID=2736875 RepID=A0ABY7MBG4_9BRAD|nr:hypothetical protein [Bradyrhizobium xenonodulans]WBL75593.1 hypothetical protein I3J27_21410 [Bradyrhizobium xenonodulans]
MSLVISQNFVLVDSTPEFPVTLDHPVIGWHNIVTPTNIVADSEDPDFPASNLANPSTHEEWRSDDDGVQYLTVTTGTADAIDYVGIARHNFGSDQIPVRIEDGSGNVLVEEVLLADDSPALFRFTSQSLAQVRIRMVVTSDVHLPRAAVVYVGKLLVLERRIYVGHTPLKHARKINVQSGYSETGNFLGRIVLGAWRETVIPLSLLSPSWYRDHGGDEFLAVAAETPFFFGWRPQSYPYEIGYCWIIDNPMPVPTAPSNRIAFDLKVRGIV